jgi:hypothetical protein
MKRTSKSLKSPSSSTFRPCRRRAAAAAPQSRPDVIGCRQEVVERTQNATSFPETKKKDDDLKILTAKTSPWWPHHFHKLLNIIVEMGWSRGDFILEDATATTWAPPYQTWILKTRNQGQEPPCLHGPKTIWAGQIDGAADRRHKNPNRLLGLLGGEVYGNTIYEDV